jgi:hypothetical protein
MSEKSKNVLERNFSIDELIALEKMARIACMKYENSTKRYDGVIDKNSVEYDKFVKYNSIHNIIIDKIEELLNNLF